MHETFLEEHLFVKELFLSRKLLKTLRDSFITIANYYDEEVIFRELVLFI